jgi:hypothetical protein
MSHIVLSYHHQHWNTMAPLPVYQALSQDWRLPSQSTEAATDEVSPHMSQAISDFNDTQNLLKDQLDGSIQDS